MERVFHEDTLLTGTGADCVARALFDVARDLPLICPHGHTDPAWFATDAPFADPAALLVTPDHYITRMFASQRMRLEDFGVERADGRGSAPDPRDIWRRFAEHYYLFRGTPTRLWLDITFDRLFGLTRPLSASTADESFDLISERLVSPEFRPRALFVRFNIEVLATTDGALDPLSHHRALADGSWSGRIVPTYRPDQITDPDHEDFAAGLKGLAEITGEDTGTWAGYLEAHRIRRAFFRELGATATDHGVPDAATADLAPGDAAALYDRVRRDRAEPGDAALFRAQMLTEMARMSAEDGMVMQIHPGALRNHNRKVFAAYGRDRGFDIPTRAEFTRSLAPLLNAVGDAPGLKIVLFTLDESVYARELAPLAGAWPCLTLGPAWWFHDSVEGMRRFREQTTETAGIYNTAGFNDDTRAFPSVPARHEVARRVDCAYLAGLVADHRLREDEAFEMIAELTTGLARRTYRL
ncbi:glucuronate isomerase [Roseobacter ponti]|uniref:Uronate isomerase n=1 Tax=Roseobacter ponti TaxID=1891787 RepID=A0A858SWC5_9RHOB|nr:glucuronate isomerase [Roseobacter ponti]QJF51166.1 glucuronate isomerase [Roseobacter ponti]